MYGFGAVGEAVFRGRELTSVTFAEHAISMSFGDDVTVTSHGGVWYTIEPGAPVQEDRFPLSGNRLMALIGKSVLSLSKESSTAVRLALSDLAEIQLRDDSPQYECHLISHPRGELVV
jgi:hypothetical protein